MNSSEPDQDPFRSRSLLAGTIVALALALPPTGCVKPTGPVEYRDQKVTGKVMLASGRPLTKGRVVLVPLQEPFMQLAGKIGPDGSFTVSAGGLEGGGVSHGKFQVSIEPGGGVKTAGFPAKYLDPSRSELTTTIAPETTELEPFVLK